ncbi:MAG: hypothetical protein JO301_05975 [Chitinophagaceae bacterium]|nr:hypothetical protein [Chitinophagaceae bacterium]
MRFTQPYKWLVLAAICIFGQASAIAQTDIDAIMMSKQNFCSGFMYGRSHWNEYWEGSFKRNNENLGTVTNKMIGVMGNYGVSGRLNLLFSLPYISTNASSGTLHGQKGLQDLSLWVKWMPVETSLGSGTISLYGLAGVSLPVSSYTPDFLPMSIGLHSKNLSLRGMIDYQIGSWSTTASATYIARSNIKIDRTSYYTTEMHLTNEVEMPDASSINLRTGYRSGRMIAEAVFNQWTTLGGFDITKNNMPFPSNRMNAASIGFNLKYNLRSVSGLSIIATGEQVLSGRNVGQATGLSGGIFYIMDFSHKTKTKTSASSTTHQK